MIVGGLIVGSFGMAGAFAYARYNGKYQWRFVRWMNRTPVSFRNCRNQGSQLPPLFFPFSLALPVLLIAGNSILSQTSFESDGAWLVSFRNAIGFLGDKNLALTMGAVLALWLLLRSPVSRGHKSELR